MAAQKAAVIEVLADRALLDSLLNGAFTYLFITRAALQSHPDWYPYLNHEFLRRFADIKFMDNDVVVYRLRRPKVEI
jgi:hypothetical protein